jgi:hypothetical protein
MLAWLYGAIVQRCRAHGVTPIFVAVPITGKWDPVLDERASRSIEVARTAGFRIIDCRHAYDGLDPDKRWIAPWDSHPNAECHRMLAGMLYEKINEAGL